MKGFQIIKKIKNNFKCFGCKEYHYYSYEYRSKNIYCEDCQNKKSWFGKLLEKIFKTK